MGLLDICWVMASGATEGGEVCVGLEVGMASAARLDAGVVFPCISISSAATIRYGKRIVMASFTIGNG